MGNGEFVRIVTSRLKRRYGEHLHTDLVHYNMTDLFVATLLSPQCTDKQVNNVTKSLFRRFRTFDDYAEADTRILMRYLSGLNYYKTKARHLKKASRMMIDRFGGVVPRTISELMELPGVGRKVANVVLNEGFGIDEGIAIDTHCITVAKRLHLSRYKDGNKVEKDLMKKVPKKDWDAISNLFIALGRDTCKARAKECGRCVLSKICPSSYLISAEKNESRHSFPGTGA